MNKKRPYYIPESQWIEDLPSYILKAAYRYLPLTSFGFHETYRYKKDDEGLLIVSSEWCKVRFRVVWERHPYDHYGGTYWMKVHYGRLHAPNQSYEMEWRGERCKCWLNLGWNHVLEFINANFPGKQRPTTYKEVRDSIPEIEVLPDANHQFLAITAEIWRHYVPELFDLFDLRRPELWEQYRDFLRACYVAEGRNEEEDEKLGLIPYYRVC